MSAAVNFGSEAAEEDERGVAGSRFDRIMSFHSPCVSLFWGWWLIVILAVFECETFLDAEPVKSQFENTGPVQSERARDLIEQPDVGHREADMDTLSRHEPTVAAGS